MRPIVEAIVLSAGWRRRFLAMSAGAFGALAMAPVDFVPAMVIAMSVAVWLLDGAACGEKGGGWRRLLQPRSFRAAAGIGWWWGFGYFVGGLWWLGAAFLVEPEKYAWALPLGVLGVPAGLAVFPALGFGLARLLWSHSPARVLIFAAMLGLSEWLRSWVFSGFPWNNFGMAFGGHLMLSQIASIVGNGGLTLLVIAICASPATLADVYVLGDRKRSARYLIATGFAAFATLGVAGFGYARIPPKPLATVPGVRLRIMQPNAAEDDTFSYANKDKILADYLDLSDRATSPNTSGLAEITHLIWPESAFPFILSRDPDALDAIAKALPASTILVTGAARMEGGGSSGEAKYFNAIEVIGPGGTVLDDYDKVHLVPFGEYLPWGDVLRKIGLTNFVHIPGGFTPGRRRRLMEVPGLPPMAPSVCYEAIFSDEMLSKADRLRMGAILNVTNDGWFGNTAGPYQHFSQARLRAVEQGVPMIRAANSGISAVIDPYGRVTAALPVGARNILDFNLPKRIDPTWFSKNPFVPTALLFPLMSVLGAIPRFRHGRN